MTLGSFTVILPKDGWQKAKEAALKAIQKDPYNAQALSILAEVALMYDWDQTEAERLYKRAIDINPSSADAHAYYAWFLHMMGRQTDSRLRDPYRPQTGSSYTLVQACLVPDIFQ